MFALLLVVIGVVCGQSPQNETFYKRLRFEGGLLYAEIMYGDSWWNRIHPYHVYLGAIPLSDMKHMESIIKLNVTGVISVVESFELREGWFHKPVTKNDWGRKGVVVEQIPAEDFSALTYDQLARGVSTLSRLLMKGPTYIHCKSGVGRSASVVMAYLMQIHKMSYDAAHELIKKSRPHININLYQRLAILNYIIETRKC